MSLEKSDMKKPQKFNIGDIVYVEYLVCVNYSSSAGLAVIILSPSIAVSMPFLYEGSVDNGEPRNVHGAVLRMIYPLK